MKPSPARRLYYGYRLTSSPTEPLVCHSPRRECNRVNPNVPGMRKETDRPRARCAPGPCRPSRRACAYGLRLGTACGLRRRARYRAWPVCVRARDMTRVARPCPSIRACACARGHMGACAGESIGGPSPLFRIIFESQFPVIDSLRPLPQCPLVRVAAP